MGPIGAPTRVLAAHFHSHWTYAGDAHAPGMISAARMLDEFRFRDVTDATAIYGVVGSPLTHSASPAMHNAAFRAAGVDAVYLPLVASSADDFTIFATALGVQGVSITIPYKVDLFQRADDVDELGTKVGAVNTYRRDGLRWEARNTDVSGFLAPLAGRLNLRGAARGHSGNRRSSPCGSGCAGLGRQRGHGLRQKPRTRESRRGALWRRRGSVSGGAGELGSAGQYHAGRDVSERRRDAVRRRIRRSRGLRPRLQPDGHASAEGSGGRRLSTSLVASTCSWRRRRTSRSGGWAGDRLPA